MAGRPAGSRRPGLAPTGRCSSRPWAPCSYLATRLHLGRRSTALAVAAVLAGTPILLVASHAVVAVAAAQTVLQLTLAMTGIHAGRLLHDAVPSPIRAGVSSGAGTLSWMLFLPFSLGFGALARSHGVYTAGWVIVGTSAALATLLILPPAPPRPLRPKSRPSRP